MFPDEALLPGSPVVTPPGGIGDQKQPDDVAACCAGGVQCGVVVAAKIGAEPHQGFHAASSRHPGFAIRNCAVLIARSRKPPSQ